MRALSLITSSSILCLLVLFLTLSDLLEVSGFRSLMTKPPTITQNHHWKSKSSFVGYECILSQSKHLPIETQKGKTLFATLDSRSSSDQNPVPQANFFQKFWKLTVGWFLTVLNRLVSKAVLFRKGNSGASNKGNQEESIATMKALAREDKLKEVRDDVIIVSSSVPIQKIVPQASAATAATAAVAVSASISTEATSTANSAFGLNQARKVVEKKLKEIEEQRKQQKQVTPAVTASIVTSFDATSVNDYAASNVDLLSSSPAEAVVEKSVEEISVVTLSATATATQSEDRESAAVKAVKEVNEANLVETSFSSSTLSSSPVQGIQVGNTVSSIINAISDEPLAEPSSDNALMDASESPLSSLFPVSKYAFADFKSKGLSGVIAYVATELGFWAIYPVLISIFQSASQDPFTDEVTFSTSQLVGFSAIFLGIARFAVPLRAGLALSLIPWVEENITQRFLKNYVSAVSNVEETATAVDSGSNPV